MSNLPKIKTGTERREWVYLTDGELERFFSVVNSKGSLRDRALFRIVYEFGLRASEPSYLNRNELKTNPDTGECLVMIYRLKGGYHAKLPLSKDATRLLNQYLRTRSDQHAALFYTDYKGGGSIGRHTIYKDFGRFAEAARIPKKKRFPHILRHTIATKLRSSGAKPEDIQYWLGHVSVASTMIYAKADEQVRSNIGRMVTRIAKR
ncbi:MAG: site-specific integrase [bacterium]|nr:site-specific integrase [bacterium]